jgi:hypothetical protein
MWREERRACGDRARRCRISANVLTLIPINFFYPFFLSLSLSLSLTYRPHRCVCFPTFPCITIRRILVLLFLVWFGLVFVLVVRCCPCFKSLESCAVFLTQIPYVFSVCLQLASHPIHPITSHDYLNVVYTHIHTYIYIVYRQATVTGETWKLNKVMWSGMDEWMDGWSRREGGYSWKERKRK